MRRTHLLQLQQVEPQHLDGLDHLKTRDRRSGKTEGIGGGRREEEGRGRERGREERQRNRKSEIK